jgi:beta-glucanase (GH16 family)
LAFSDEFGGAYSAAATGSKTSPDASKWEMQTGRGPNNDGWGNGESQTYTNSLNNAYVQGGALHIVADKTGNSTTSARLKSVFDVLPNGYVEVKAAFPDMGAGAWPAIWLLGQGAWPATGEIDIMEWTSQYFKANQVQAALHFQGAGNPTGDKTAWTYGDTQKKDPVTLSGPIENFHTYQVWWTQDYIRFGVDANSNDAYYHYNKPANATSANWPFTNPMDLILNLAVGGSLGGAVPAGDFSYEMLVDHVKVYQGSASVSGPTTAAPAPSGVSNAEAISLFSDALTDDLVVTNFNPGWGQSGSLAPASDVGSSVGNVLKFTNLNYQGIELNKVDVSQKQSLHIDLWAATAGKVKLFLVSNAGGAVSESGILLDVTAGSWNSFDIDLDAFSGTSLGNVFQVKFDSQAGAVGQGATGLTNFYMDNLYFSGVLPVL